jgi:hypothetical protein
MSRGSWQVPRVVAVAANTFTVIVFLWAYGKARRSGQVIQMNQTHAKAGKKR